MKIIFMQTLTADRLLIEYCICMKLCYWSSLQDFIRHYLNSIKLNWNVLYILKHQWQNSYWRVTVGTVQRYVTHQLISINPRLTGAQWLSLFVSTICKLHQQWQPRSWFITQAHIIQKPNSTHLYAKKY